MLRKASTQQASGPNIFGIGTSFAEDNFSMDLVAGWGGNLFHPLLTSCCEARVLTGHRRLPVHGPGLGTPALEAPGGYSPVVQSPIRPEVTIILFCLNHSLFLLFATHMHLLSINRVRHKISWYKDRAMRLLLDKAQKTKLNCVFWSESELVNWAHR